jgi:hypothetical protein
MVPRACSRSAVQPGRVRQQARQQVNPVDPQPAQPAEMIKPQVVGLHPVGHLGERRARIDPGRGAGTAHERDGGVADPDDPRPEAGRHHLGDDAGRIGHRDDPRVSGQLRDAAGDRVDHRHGPRRVRQAAGPDCLLAEHAEFQRGPLVPDPAVQPAHPQRGEDQAGVVQRGVEIGGRAQRQVITGQHIGDHLEPLSGHVEQYDLVGGQAAGGKFPADQWYPEAAAAENGDSHAPTLSGRLAWNVTEEAQREEA